MDGNGSTPATDSVAALNQKVDMLIHQMAFLMEEARQNQRRRQEWDEFKADVTPVAGDLFRITVNQLEEVEQHVQMEDILHLLKRLLRNTRNLEQMLDQLESMAEFGRDISPLTQDAFLTLMERLETFEQKGYFAFLQGGTEIVDRVVTSFSEEDIRQLGENIVLILNTVREMTQPEVMMMLQRTASVAREEEPAADVSMLQIFRQLNDPAVKRGLSKTLSLLKSVSTEPVAQVNG